MGSAVFNEEAPKKWTLFTTIPELRPQFHPGTKFLVAIGGWGDTAGFDAAARDGATRALWARNVARMLEDMGADGVDVDWEYPGYAPARPPLACSEKETDHPPGATATTTSRSLIRKRPGRSPPTPSSCRPSARSSARTSS